MASHYQPHPGPGPSNYYMQPQPPPPPPQGYVYGPGTPGAAPAPGPNGYPYQYSPAQMGSHHPGMPPASPRMNGRGAPGGANGGYIPQSSRGGHAYQPQPPANYRPPYAGAQYSHPQMPPKYPQAYQPQPPYAYAPPPPISAWGAPPQQHQPLSPLPKDRPMSPRQDAAVPAPYYTADQNQPPHQNPFPELPTSSVAPPAEPDVDPAESAVPTSPTLPSHSSYGQIGTISALSSASSPKLAETALPTPPGSPRPSNGGGWAIWSRRPLDPAHAPGIIISPHANPPPEVVLQALDARTPPPSPVLVAQVVEEAVEVEAESEVEPESEVAETPSSGASTTDARTPTTTTTTIPGSPVSSATSISLSTPPPKTVSVAADSPPSAAEAPAPQDAAPTAPPPKKSWASLLRSTDPTTATPAKNGLPTSSVVGVSIPAAAPPPIDLFAPSPELALAPRGLVNTGNMCFANAVLQALVHCPPFAALVARLGPPGAGGLLGATGAFVREFVVQKAEGKGDAKGKGEGKGKGRAQEEEEEGEAFVATGVYDALKGSKRFDHMRGGQQEDAEEFLGFFLDTLEEELLALAPAVAPPPTPAPAVVEAEEPPEAQDGWLEVGRKNRAVVTRTIKEAESPISRIFGGKFRSTLRAAGQKDSAIIEAWRALRLDIQRDAIHTIQDALSFIAHPQVVQMGAADASLQILIAALPPVLVLHVKRFYYDAAAGVVKLAKRVTFGPELEIGGDVLAPTATTTGRKPVRYKLFAAVYHHGVSAAGGHYTLDVLHATRGWVRIDDELVSDVRAEDVFGVEREREEGRCAYLLFYRRVR
ncbi:hypothetical protein DFH09DRAFT_1041863 [Mycena vulgaris]|nr:hypothetical protein DFH09DRAFT_1041863 [Mycena vulgaris]